MKKRQLKQSFKDAFRGISFVYKHEKNFRIQLFFAFLVVFFMLSLSIKKSEMIVLLLLILAVLSLEMINSAIEKFVDILKPRLHIQIGVIKDIMAATVLLVSIGAVIVGVLIFWPYFSNLW